MNYKLVAKHNQQKFRSVSRSLRISGHSTSIRLEAAFWNVLDAIAIEKGSSIPKLVAVVHDEALGLLDSDSARLNLASILRTICLIYETDAAACGRNTSYTNSPQ